MSKRSLTLATLVLLFAAPAWASGVSLRGHDARGAAFDIGSLRGQVVALTFASRYTQREAAEVNRVLGDRARPAQVAVVSVIDFVGIPRLFHGFARGQVARHDRPERAKLLVDEESLLKIDLGVEPAQGVDILVIGTDGSLRGRYHGPAQLPEAVRLIEQLRIEAIAASAVASAD